MSLSPLVISHAACKGHAPENTLEGIRAALAFGVDGIEIDVHCSADRVPVLIHDATVDRTTNGSGPVATLTREQLRRLDAGAHAFAGRFSGARMPDLAETLDLTRGHCLLVVEVKAEGIEDEVERVLRPYPDDVMVWSFRRAVVERMRQVAPAVPAALLSPPLENADAATLFRDALTAGAQGISLYHSSVTAELIDAARRRGLTVFTWTADERDDQQRLLGTGVAGIVTNFPDVLADVVGPMRAATR